MDQFRQLINNTSFDHLKYLKELFTEAQKEKVMKLAKI